MSCEIAIRLDTEDFLTPASDDALARILDIFEARGVTATFPLVGCKLRSWQRAGRHDLIRRLRSHAVGYHSDTHSLHPTIAEELAPLPWPDACAAFVARERQGLDLVTAAFGPPACWTQPGGNWTAPALAAARVWGIPMDFSEAWNSYLDVGAAPCRFGGILHWSPPVSAPKPFLSGLPENLAEAVAGLEHDAAAAPTAPLCVVAHPTELCTTAFWDAVNFAGGRMPPKHEWRPAPVRPAAEIEAAAAALDRYIDALQRMGASFITARDLTRRHPDLAAGAHLPAEAVLDLAALWTRTIDAAACGGMALSAAEIFALLCSALAEGGAPAIRSCDGPEAAAPSHRTPAAASRDALTTAARWSAAFIAERRRMPAAIPVGTASVPPAAFGGAVARLLADPAAERAPLLPTELPFTRVVKPPERLHWDWPIFPPGFAPTGLWEMTRLQSWTWKPAPAHPVPPDRQAARWTAASS
jgi:hypothetical protein